jgi:hypothetical protein
MVLLCESGHHNLVSDLPWKWHIHKTLVMYVTDFNPTPLELLATKAVSSHIDAIPIMHSFDYRICELSCSHTATSKLP